MTNGVVHAEFVELHGAATQFLHKEMERDNVYYCRLGVAQSINHGNCFHWAWIMWCNHPGIQLVHTPDSFHHAWILYDDRYRDSESVAGVRTPKELVSFIDRYDMPDWETTTPQGFREHWERNNWLFDRLTRVQDRLNERFGTKLSIGPQAWIHPAKWSNPFD